MNLKSTTIWVILVCYFTLNSHAQFTLDLSKGHSLHIQHSIDYDGADIEISLSSFEAKEYVDKIVAFTGLPRKFEIVQSKEIENAMAHFDGKKHYLIYNEDFFSRIKESKYSTWPEIFVLIHEVGHLLIQHPSVEDPYEGKKLELEADQFAGFSLNLLGATVQETLSYIDNFSEKGKENHPSREKRIKAITDGWNLGNLKTQSINGKCNSNEGSITFVNESSTRVKVTIKKGISFGVDLILLPKKSQTINLEYSEYLRTYKGYTPIKGVGNENQYDITYPKFAGTITIIPCKTQVFTLE